MRILIAAVLLGWAGPGLAQTPCNQPRSQACADSKWQHLVSVIDTMPNLKALFRGPEDFAVRGKRFSKLAVANAEARTRQWQLLDDLLRGGKLDPDGSAIRGQLVLLPPEQWYFVAILEDRRRSLYKDLGSGLPGNVASNFGGAQGFLCFERSASLLKGMKVVKDAGRDAFAKWSATDLGANLLRITLPAVQGGEHHAPCFSYHADKYVVDIVADAWSDMLVPAQVWWKNYDRDAYEHLVNAAPVADGYCGKTYEAWGAVQRAKAEKVVDAGIVKGLIKDNVRSLWQKEKQGMEGLRDLISSWGR